MQMTGRAIARLVTGLMLLALSSVAQAETVEVAPGVQVTKKTFSGPIEQQPFFGFVEKTAEQRAADERFITDLIAAAGSRQQAFDAVTVRGWKAVLGGRSAEAAKRFNQAYLLLPERSAVYHGLAMVAQMRFHDLAFAEELFRQAYKQPHPLKMLNTDYGRLLLMAKRYRDAQPVLEKAVIDTPDFGDAWAYLAFARLKNGDRAGACAAVAEATNRHPSTGTIRDIVHLRKDAQCN